MAKYVIIGGGLAGISSAVFLTKNNHKVHLIEASPKLGGRAYSFIDKTTNDIIDNGQHILVGAYKTTFELLRIIGTENLPYYQKKLYTTYITKGGKSFTLKASHIFYPLNLLQAILSFDLLNFNERVGIIKIISKLVFLNKKELVAKTVLEWLEDNNQSENSIKVFWELLTVSTLNTPIEEASSLMFAKVLKEIFLKGNKAATIVLPNYGLSELFCEPAEKYLKNSKAEISLSEKVISIETDGEKVTEVKTNKKAITDFDFVISAVPFYLLQKLLPELPLLNLVNENIEVSPIITIHLWLDKDILEEKFYGLIDSKIHWIYKNKNHYSVVISAAEEMVELDSKEIYEICFKELEKYFPKIKNVVIQNYKVLKEKRATFKSTPKSDEIRKKIKSPYKNFLLAGDWTNTKFPSTIEGAILSGKSYNNKTKDQSKKIKDKRLK